MSELKCFSCKNEIPAGKYYQLYQLIGAKAKEGDFCSPCWAKEKTRYEIEIKNGMLKVIEAERERERAKSLWKMPKEPSWGSINRGGNPKNQFTL